ncbi:MAG: DUF3422 domain-containing protein [Alphaproteobacteria bacterium]|nr:DUF3422 domain-containing protein [Alphaproteobacteria bacterium]MDE2493070.1 DUF3422 domain-containing protein [Alphaproteobacteria bacterium]
MERTLFIPGSVVPPTNHPLRSFISEEMHVRRIPHFESPTRLVQFVMQGEAHIAQLGMEHIQRLGDVASPPTTKIGKYFVQRVGAFDLIFEAHSEFCTFIVVASGRKQPLNLNELEEAFPVDWFASLPGRTIQATQILYLPVGEPDPTTGELARIFSRPDIVVCDLAGGKARLWSDFDVHGDGFGRLIVADRGMRGFEPSNLIQRLLEQGHYRNMALLGLPEAQRLMPQVAQLDQRLSQLTASIAEQQQQDDELLREVSFLSAELAQLIASTRYRMSATRAYAQLSNDRLRSLDVRVVPGYQCLTDFTERRLMPAARTCDSFSNRLDELSQRVSWTSALLRTRVDTAVEKQNRDQLRSMNHRVALQLRLQHTVEGLSVVAISYYAIGLLKGISEGLSVVLPQISPEVATGSITIPVVALVWFALRRVKRHLHAIGLDRK